MSNLPRCRRLPVVVLATWLTLVGCSGAESETSRVLDASTDVPFNGCDKVKCSDVLNGAAYEIRLPSTWNGTLLIYSHGYRSAQPAPPDFAPVDTSAQVAQDDVTAATLLEEGYALAGSAYASNGWAVTDGVTAAENLHQFFVDNVARPNRTLVWGSSLGGLITQMIAEKHPEWVDGVAPLCGAVAGVVPNMNLALDVSYAVKTLIYPALKLTGYGSYEEAVTNWTRAVKAIATEAADTQGGGTAKVLYVAALVDGPTQTRTYDGSPLESRVKAAVEGIATGLGYATLARYDLEQRFGGNPSGNDQVDYAARISDSERSLIDGITPGAAARFDRELALGTLVTADPAARSRALAEGGDPQGTITRPTITLHTASDPLVLVQNESFFRARVDKARSSGTATQPLVQLYTVAPASYAEGTGAPYGAGHCNFTVASQTGVIDLLNAWVQRGVFPGAAAVQKALGASSGYVADWVPGPWPEPDQK